ncbi:MAG: FtsX-like permease family protein [Chloroflexota bacterium]|nr:FtsX-like permease family protein [Chloroflexota bacterium]
MSLLQEAWHVVIRRTRADWLVLAAAALVVFLAVTLLAAGAIYGDAVALSGLHRALRDAPVGQSNLQVSVAAIDHPTERTAAVNRTIDDLFGSLEPAVIASGRSGSFALPGQDHASVSELAVFDFADGIADHATLAQGAWPATGARGTVEAAISEAVAQGLGLKVGDALVMPSRLQQGAEVTVSIVGIYRIASPADPYWWDDQLDLEGVVPGKPYSTHGPFIVSRETFLTAIPPSGAHLIWRAYPDYARLGLGEVDSLQVRATSARPAFVTALRDPDVEVRSGLPDLLTDLQRALLATRTSVLLVTVQLAVLAGYALAMTAGLLVEQRRSETAMLRSRGADTSQVGALALMEGVLVAIPVALLAPYTASLALALLNTAGPLASIGLRIDPEVTPLSRIVALVAAAACIAGLTIPALRAGRVFMEQRRGRGRQLRLGATQRAGLDIALLLVAAIGLWQLQRYGAPLTRSVQGQLGIDPLLVAAPALGLLAGGVLALRIVPLISRAIEGFVTRTRGAVAPLGAWQLARRPGRYARAGLLLILALALGIFSAAYASTWTDAQADQADFQVGADVRISNAGRAGDVHPIDASGAYEALAGVEHAMAVSQGTAGLPRSIAARLVAIDAATAPAVIRLRPDLAKTTLTGLAASLAGPRPDVTLPTLPADARQLAITISMTVNPDPDGQVRGAPFGVSLVVRDARGLMHRLEAGQLTALANQTTRLTADLTDPAAGAAAVPRGPLQMVAMELWTQVPVTGLQVTGQAKILRLEVATSTADWRPLELDPGTGGWQVTHYVRIGVDSGLVAPQPAAPSIAAFSFATGVSFGGLTSQITFAVQPGGVATAKVPRALAILVDTAFLRATAARIGDEIPVDLGGGVDNVSVAGSLTAFPTSQPGEPTIIVDLPTLQLAQYRASGQVEEPDEWWLAVQPARVDAVLAALHRGPFLRSTVGASTARAQQLRSDPVAVGIIGALTIGVLAAAVFAAVGFASSSAISARERLSEFALLRAVGLSRRQLSGWLALENALLVVMSAVAGTAIGLAISWAVLPSALLAEDGRQPVPPPTILVPLQVIGLFEAALVAVLVVLVLLLTVFLRRLGLGAVLRVGEE